MSFNAIKNRTAVAGVGWTQFSNDSQKSVLSLALEASLNAIADAGLEVADIDGVITYFWHRDTVPPQALVHALGLRECNFQLFNALGGGWSAASVAAAAMAVHSGLCKNVLVYRAVNGKSEPKVSAIPPSENQFTAPFGVAHAAAKFGPYVTAYMEHYGLTSEDLGRLAVMQRKHAGLNTKAVMRKSMSIEDHQASPWIVRPFRLLDCCLRADGAMALIVTSTDRARDLRQGPVLISSFMGGTLTAHTGTGRTEQRWHTNAVHAAPRLYAAAGIEPSDVDIAEIYDPFTGMCILHLEQFGLVPEGGAADFLRAGEHGLDGRLPVNTHGGLLSEGDTSGLGQIVEAVQQLRPGGVVDDLCQGPHDHDRVHCRQVRDPQIALVCGETGDSSLILSRA